MTDDIQTQEAETIPCRFLFYIMPLFPRVEVWYPKGKNEKRKKKTTNANANSTVKRPANNKMLKEPNKRGV
jgi:hypothetical protein